MKVVEIFKSIEGEGLRTGLPVVFLRFHGCNLRCSYCDTKYSYEAGEYTNLSIQHVFESVAEYGLKSITITGGEPLIQTDIHFLVAALLNNDYKVNIETNGSVDIEIFENQLLPLLLNEFDLTNLLYTIDYKCNTSGMQHRMCANSFLYLKKSKFRSSYAVKFVVGSLEDLETARQVINDYELNNSQVFISPVFGKIEPVDIVNYVLNHKCLHNCRVQVQLHKIIWNPNERGV